MLQQIMEHIHNMFIKTPNPGTYTIADGVISLPFLKEGQRFWIVGSDLNDGVYTYHQSKIMDDDDLNEVGLRDETFEGNVCALAVPPAVIALAGEISTWVEKYGESIKSPYQSEDVIGVYSYTKASGSGDAGGNPNGGWRGAFSSELNRWRKVAL